ncbi:MAG TPA: histidine kinase N-terminal 7TM domain-containing protein [Myxococcota bacterium]|nr:histidine kinase N-terminal 7TM domain-containing protein [Myxococcota bacterium]
MPELSAWTPFLLVAACGYLALATALLQRRYGPGTRTIGLCMLCVSVWTVSSVTEWRSNTAEAALLAAKVKYTAIALVPPLFLLFLLRHLERMHVRTWHLLALFAVPAATIAVAWTNDHHGWMWALPAVTTGEHGTVRSTWGIWMWRVHLPYSYVLVGTSLTVIAAEWWRESKLYRSQVALLFAATLLPSVVNVLFTIGFFEFEFGPTPIALAVSCVLYAWGFVRLQLFRMSGVAYHAVFDHMQDGVVVVDGYDRVVDVNPAASRMLSCDRDRVVGYRVEELLPSTSGLAEALHARAGSNTHVETADGRRLDLAISPILLPTGRLRGRVVMLRDMTERQRAEAALRRSEALVRGIVDGSPNGILRLRPRRDAAGEVRDFLCVFANPAAAAWLGKAQIELMGRPFKEVVHPHTPFLFQSFREVLRTGEACDVERPTLRNGEEHWLRLLAVPAGEDLLVTVVDVTEPKQRERAMEEAACQDPLTGLLNRRGLEADAVSLLADTTEQPTPAALLYVDLDDFKRVNDSLGHEAGDVLLCEVAARLQRCTRGPDLLARIGGDEFVLLLPDVDAAGARDVAERVLASAREPVRIDEREVCCGVSVGIALFPEDGGDLKGMLQAADRAMYRAKSAGGGIAGAA